MKRLFRLGLVPLIWLLLTSAARAQGQQPSAPVEVPPNLPVASFIALTIVLIVMVIVCMPSRKRQRTERI